MSKTNAIKYDANFTAGGILYNEFTSLKPLLLSDNFEELIKIEEEQNNLMAIATNSARKRIISEIIRRYKTAPNNFWEYFFEWNESEQKLGLFYLCLKTYPLIMDIHLEVSVKKFMVGNQLVLYDIHMRFDEIASMNENVANWSTKTLDKLNSQYRTALKEIGLLTKGTLQKTEKGTTVFWNYFKDNNEQWFLKACFL